MRRAYQAKPVDYSQMDILWGHRDKEIFPDKWINSIIIIDLVFIYFYSFPYPRWSDSKSIESHRCSFSKHKDITFFYIYKVLYQKKMFHKIQDIYNSLNNKAIKVSDFHLCINHIKITVTFGYSLYFTENYFSFYGEILILGRVNNRIKFSPDRIAIKKHA